MSKKLLYICEQPFAYVGCIFGFTDII